MKTADRTLSKSVKISAPVIEPFLKGSVRDWSISVRKGLINRHWEYVPMTGTSVLIDPILQFLITVDDAPFR